MEIVSNPTYYEPVIKAIDFEIKGDERGALISVENLSNIPFEIKRVYYIFDTKAGVRRGKHAHRKLQQVLICTSGKCSVLLDDGQERFNILLNRPDKGLYIGGLIWREMYDFSPDCTLMVLANNIYLESDYIRDYQTFIKLAKES